MRFIVLLLTLLLMSPSLALAQASLLTGTAGSEAEADPTSASQTDASIDELIKIIENDQTRAALIERLQQAEGATSAAPAAEPVPADLSIVRQLAEYTRAMAEGASSTIRSLGTVFVDLQAGLSGSDGTSLAGLTEIAGPVLLVAVGLFGSYLLLRALGHLLSSRLAAGLETAAWWRRSGAAVIAVLIDLSTVLLAWGIGYVVALNFAGQTPGRMGINQSLLLNAFLLVEITKLAARAILAPRLSALRLLPVSDDNAAYWFFWLSRIISLIGYCFLFIAPLLAANLSPGVAAAVKVLVMATAATIAIIIVMQNRDDVRLWLNSRAAQREDGLGQLLVMLGRCWHLIAIAYVLALLVVWFTNPEQALPFMLSATVQSMIAVVAGVVIVGFIARFVGTGLILPSDIKDRLPLLEKRLNVFVPRVMQIVRWVVIAGVLVAIAQVCLALYVGVSSWVEFRLNPNFGKVPTAREKTLLGLFRNAFTIALMIFGVMLALAQIGVNIAPLLAGAGVIGLAIGFGAQKLVQDIITGIFIQFENVMNEGDVVAVGDKSGVVEKLTIRSVTIRDLNGTVHLIPFSSVDQVSNMVRGFSFHVAEIGVAYDSDIAAVKQAMLDGFDRLMETEHKEFILDNLEMHGVTGFGDSAITVRARIKTLPGQQWGTGRAYNEIIKMMFEERGIEIPYPHVTYVAAAKPKKSIDLPPQLAATSDSLEQDGPNEDED